MSGILDAAVQVDRTLRESLFQFCFIGGVALQRWGQPRMTVDLDVTVMSGFGAEESTISRLVTLFPQRIADAVDFAKQSRVVLLKTEHGIGIDVALGAMPFEERMMARASDWPVDEQRVIRTCSAEDLIVLKTFAGRDQDWIDIRCIIERQTSARLDTMSVLQEVQPLLELKEDRAAFDRLSQLLQEAGSP